MYICPHLVGGIEQASFVVTMCSLLVSRCLLRKSTKGRMNMEKQLSTVAYWIGIISTVLALITRLLAVFGVFVSTSASGKIPITYRSFLDGAILFFMMAIASSIAMWVKAQKQ